MSKFFRADDSSDSEDAPLPHSPVSGPSRDRGRFPGTDSDSDSDSDIPRVAPGPEDLIDRPSLPVPVDLIPAVRAQRDPKTVPAALPATLIQDILRTVPTLNMEEVGDLCFKFTFRRLACDGIDIWLQAIDPDTGDSLLHSIVRGGRIAALGACLLGEGWCCTGIWRQRGRRERHLLVMHQNHEGDTGLHVAARTGRVSLVRAVLRLLGGGDHLDGPLRPREFSRAEDQPREGGTMFWWDAERILFIEARNVKGMNVVEEARHCGQTMSQNSSNTFSVRRTLSTAQTGRPRYSSRELQWTSFIVSGKRQSEASDYISCPYRSEPRPAAL